MDEFSKHRLNSNEMIVNTAYPPSPSKIILRESVGESEYTILSDFATGLSSYVTRRASQSRPNTLHDRNIFIDKHSLEEDAELLIRFMASSPTSTSSEVSGQTAANDISPSLSFETSNRCWGKSETKRQELKSVPCSEHSQHTIPINMNYSHGGEYENIITVTYPCLSLTDIDFTTNVTAHGNCNSPISLLSRPFSVTNKPCHDANKYVADQLALNSMSSFKLAMDWRVKVWVSKLVKFMRSKSGDKYSHQDQSRSVYSKILESGSSDAKLIRALLCTLSTVTVSDVRTTVQVLEQQLMSTMTSENQKEPQLSEAVSSGYKLTHAVNMEFNFTISNHYDNHLTHRMSVNLHTSGFIHGSFHISDNDLSLTNIELILDTAILSHGIECQSRNIVRAFTEEYMLSCHPALYPCIPTANMPSCVSQVPNDRVIAMEKEPISNDEELIGDDDEYSVKGSLDEHSDDSPIPTSSEPYSFPIVTPHEVSEHLEENVDSSHGFPTALSVQSMLDANPAKRQRLSPSKYFVHPRRVSPNFLKSDSNMESVKDDSIAIKSLSDEERYHSLKFPSIISPNPVHETISIDSTSSRIHGVGPSLPLLAELVCGAERGGLRS